MTTEPGIFTRMLLFLAQDRERQKRIKKQEAEFYLKYEKPLENRERELASLEFKAELLEATLKVIEENEGKLPKPWNEYITFLATEFNTSERRIRRIFRKAGFKMED
jgi:hypothetical protein